MEDPGTISISGLLIGIMSGGVINTGVLVWLALQYVRMNTNMAVLATHIDYLRREVAYANGRAEPDDVGRVQDELK